MMMLAATVALLLGTVGQVADTKVARPLCKDEQARLIRGRLGAGPHKLGQEPDADRILTVLRSENGCTRPVRVQRRR